MLKFVTDLFKPSAPKPPAPITSDTSMNFDLEEVAPFLTRLGNHPRFTFPTDFAAEISRAIGDLPVDATKRWSVTCGFDDADITLQIEAFMDDVDAPDLAFFSTQSAITEIERELEAFAEATGS